MIQHTMTEEDFDSLPTATDPSPDINLGSHLPNPLSIQMNVNDRVAHRNIIPVDKEINRAGATPTKISMDKRNIEAGGGAQKISTTTDLKRTADSRDKAVAVMQPVPVGKDKRDQINNVGQKEIAMDLAGVTRRKTYTVISKLLEARKWAEVTDKNGNVKFEWVDDLEKQRQGAEMALKVMGDMIEHKQVEYGIADSTLEKLKALSVDTLRARAAELLEGRRKASAITDAVVVTAGGAT